ncbi:hypothetical protein LX36DRAFT_387661 [Colletotrichum falcatum]|nr:hypothetical protein LX36DRAFT_387661 [Colletotrichum falcatum]
MVLGSRRWSVLFSTTTHVRPRLSMPGTTRGGDCQECNARLGRRGSGRNRQRGQTTKTNQRVALSLYLSSAVVRRTWHRIRRPSFQRGTHRHCASQQYPCKMIGRPSRFTAMCSLLLSLSAASKLCVLFFFFLPFP